MTKYHFHPDLVPMMRFLIENDMSQEDAGMFYFLFPDAQRGDYGFRERVRMNGIEINLSWVQIAGSTRVWAWRDDSNPLGTGEWFDASRCNFETGEINAV